MSTSTYTESSWDTGGAQPAGRIISGRLALVFLSEFCALTSFYLLLSVTPMYAAAARAGSAGAGLVTSVLLLGTVVAELAAPLSVALVFSSLPPARPRAPPSLPALARPGLWC